MELPLEPELERFVRDQVQSGRYARAEDVVRAALMRLKQDDTFNLKPGELATLVNEGEADIAAGNTLTMDEVREHFRIRRG